jgi:hypothetical protein
MRIIADRYHMRTPMVSQGASHALRDDRLASMGAISKKGTARARPAKIAMVPSSRREDSLCWGLIGEWRGGCKIIRRTLDD